MDFDCIALICGCLLFDFLLLVWNVCFVLSFSVLWVLVCFDFCWFAFTCFGCCYVGLRLVISGCDYLVGVVLFVWDLVVVLCIVYCHFICACLVDLFWVLFVVCVVCNYIIRRLFGFDCFGYVVYVVLCLFWSYCFFCWVDLRCYLRCVF